MEVLGAPWADLALLLRQTARETDGYLPVCLLILGLFLPVSLLLLQLIVYLCWKLREVEAELLEAQEERGAIYRPLYRTTPFRQRRSFGE